MNQAASESARTVGPLAGVRVIEMADCGGEAAGRLLADLGAEVIFVEPPGGAALRTRSPIEVSAEAYASVYLANKRSLSLDAGAPGGEAQVLALLAGADIFIADGRARRGALAARAVAGRFPHLVVLAMSPFGSTGPYRDFQANLWVLLAMAGNLSRSGLPGREPLMPPPEFATSAIAFQSVWVALVAYWNRLETGWGDLLDFAAFEAITHAVDPAIPAIDDPQPRRDLPVHQGSPIFHCRDGHVRILIFSPRQWQGLRAWLGEPEAFSDPRFDSHIARAAAAPALHATIQACFGALTVRQAVAEGQRRGVPIAPVLFPGEVLRSEHYAARGTFCDVGLPDGSQGRGPAGYLSLDGVRRGHRHPAPGVGDHNDTIEARVAPATPATPPPEDRRPLSGLRVLDLGVIVVGAESGRLFADQGAEVIKVESKAYPDGSRAALAGQVNANAVTQQRNKLAFGLNLRSDEGRRLFLDMAAQADVVLSNFKPGTLESLGIGPETLRAINPRLVTVTCSAMGDTGPWADWMGYGPLVRCASGLTSLWRFPDDPDDFGDRGTIFPDHLGGRVVDVAVLAALIARRASGQGAHVECAQAEMIINSLAATYLSESLAGGTAKPRGNIWPFDAPSGVFACAGDDDWCVVTPRGDEDFVAIATLIGREDWLSNPAYADVEGRLAARDELTPILAEWLKSRASRAAVAELQARGVAAGFMALTCQLGDDPQLVERRFIRWIEVEGAARPLPMQNAPVRSWRLPDPPLRPSPRRGEHTRELSRRLLGLGDAQIEELAARGVLEPDEAP